MRTHWTYLIHLWVNAPVEYVIDDAWLRAIDCAELHLRLLEGPEAGKRI